MWPRHGLLEHQRKMALRQRRPRRDLRRPGHRFRRWEMDKQRDKQRNQRRDRLRQRRTIRFRLGQSRSAAWPQQGPCALSRRWSGIQAGGGGQHRAARVRPRAVRAGKDQAAAPPGFKRLRISDNSLRIATVSTSSGGSPMVNSASGSPLAKRESSLLRAPLMVKPCS